MDIDEMLAFAYSECGLSVDEFFSLSWYEWSLEVYKVRQRKENEFNRWEMNVSVTREFMAMFYNVNRGKNAAKSGKDIIPLSFDNPGKKEPKETREMTPDEIKNKFGKAIIK